MPTTMPVGLAGDEDLGVQDDEIALVLERLDFDGAAVRELLTELPEELLADELRADEALRHVGQVVFREEPGAFGEVRGHELAQLGKRCFRKVSFETAYTSNIGSEAGTTNLFPYFIYQLAKLEHIREACKGTGIHSYHRIAHQVVGNTRQLHNDDTQIVDPLRRFNA